MFTTTPRALTQADADGVPYCVQQIWAWADGETDPVVEVLLCTGQIRRIFVHEIDPRAQFYNGRRWTASKAFVGDRIEAYVQAHWQALTQ